MTESDPRDPRPTDRLPAIIPPGELTTVIDTHLVPALIADAGEAAGWRYVHRQHPQPAHPPGLRACIPPVL